MTEFVQRCTHPWNHCFVQTFNHPIDEKVNQQIEELPEKWANTKKTAFQVKAQVGRRLHRKTFVRGGGKSAIGRTTEEIPNL
jgi:hypothetical protein